MASCGMTEARCCEIDLIFENTSADMASRAVTTARWLEVNPTVSRDELTLYCRKSGKGKVTFHKTNNVISHVCFDQWSRQPLKPDAGVPIGQQLAPMPEKRVRRST
jgi:hypothetical protein